MRAEGILFSIGKKKIFCILIGQLYFYVRTTQSPIRCASPLNLQLKDLRATTNIGKDFFNRKWFKLICVILFLGWLVYILYDPSEVNESQLKTLKVTVDKGWNSGRSKSPYKIYFDTKEYSNRFGIKVGGTFGRWSEITTALEDNREIEIKVNAEDNLNTETVVPIFYLCKYDSDVVFSVEDYNEGLATSNRRVLGFVLVLLLIGLWKVLKT
jgi:hypothetical protein